MAPKKKPKKKQPKKEVVKEEKVSKKVEQKENKQMFWFIVAIIAVFASFMVPYYLIQNSKTFTYLSINWTIEDYNDLRIYRGRFPSIGKENVFFNTFLRVDPRKNDVPTSGEFTDFRYSSIISVGPKINSCGTAEINRVLIDLEIFLSSGIGLPGTVTRELSDEEMAEEINRTHVTCETVLDRTVIMADIGEPKVEKDEKNPYCYRIYFEDCESPDSVEKFIVKTVEDFEKLKASHDQ